MKLRSLTLKNNFLLAPLQNVTTGPFRRFIRHLNEVGLVSVPMLYTKRLAKNPQSLEDELFKIGEERPISVQLIGNDIDSLKKGIEFLDSYPFDILDLNAGCPSNRAIKGHYGGFLLKELPRLRSLVEVALKHSSRPVSLKVRTGFREVMDVDEFVKSVNDADLEFLTIHGRTVKQRFNDSTIDLDFIKQVKQSINIPLIGNGDIYDGPTAENFIQETGVDGLMIGRAAMGNPEIFTQIQKYFETKKPSISHKSKEKVREYLTIYESILEEYLVGISLKYSKGHYKFVELKRNAIWFTKNVPNSTVIRTALSKTKNLVDLRKTLNEYLN